MYYLRYKEPWDVFYYHEYLTEEINSQFFLQLVYFICHFSLEIFKPKFISWFILYYIEEGII